MRTVGLIGGMSWESSLTYYQRINTLVKERLGGLHSARLVLYSVDFHTIEALQRRGDWDEAGRQLTDAGRALRAAGAECLLICTNTMHKVADAVETGAGVPLLHIADTTGDAIRAAGLQRIGLLGTRFTMEEAFYRDRLRERYGIATIIPDAADRARVHAIIYDELCLGHLLDSSRAELLAIVDRLAAQGAQGVVLGCTELPLLLQPGDCTLPSFDTTELHARAAVAFSLDQVCA